MFPSHGLLPLRSRRSHRDLSPAATTPPSSSAPPPTHLHHAAPRPRPPSEEDLLRGAEDSPEEGEQGEEGAVHRQDREGGLRGEADDGPPDQGVRRPVARASPRVVGGDGTSVQRGAELRHRVLPTAQRATSRPGREDTDEEVRAQDSAAGGYRPGGRD